MLALQPIGWSGTGGACPSGYPNARRPHSVHRPQLHHHDQGRALVPSSTIRRDAVTPFERASVVDANLKH